MSSDPETTPVFVDKPAFPNIKGYSRTEDMELETFRRQQWAHEDVAIETERVCYLQKKLNQCFMHHAPNHMRKCHHIVEEYAKACKVFNGLDPVHPDGTVIRNFP